jgi:hypothetical protein
VKNLIEVTKSADLNVIMDVVHDHFFDLPSLLDQRGSVRIVELREWLGLWKPRPSDKYEILRIHNVLSVHVNDTEHVERYDLNRITYAEEGIVTLITGITLDLSLRVSALHLTLEQY